MEKINNTFKVGFNKSSEKIEKAREKIRSMLGLSKEEVAKLSDAELEELSSVYEGDEFGDETEVRETEKEEKSVELSSNFETSLLNQIISDPVLRYALEKGHLRFLRKVKNGEIKDEEYESMREEMKENGWENIKLEWSLLQEISKDYIYYLALEKVDTKMLRWLLEHNLSFNYKYHEFAPKNWVDDVMQLLWWWVAADDYYKWIAQKGLK